MHPWFRRAALVALGYVVVGLTTIALARAAPSSGFRTAARLSAWGVSALLFAAHIRFEHRSLLPPTRAAARTSLAVALATLVLAAIAVVRQLQGSHVRSSMLLAFAIWPILTGAVSFVVAAVVFTFLARSGPPSTTTST